MWEWYNICDRTGRLSVQLAIVAWTVADPGGGGGGGGGGGVGGVATPPFKPAINNSLIGNSEQKKKIPKGASTLKG